MATVAQIIEYALQLTKVVGVGKSPKTAETALGVVAFQSLLDQWVHAGMFGDLIDLTIEEDDTALEGYRYYVPSGVSLTDAATEYIDADNVERQPRDLALYEVLTAAGTRTVKLYDRTGWVELTGLTSASTAPLSGRGAMGLAACLATSGGFVASFGGEVSQGVLKLANDFTRSLMSKQGTTQDTTAGVYF